MENSKNIDKNKARAAYLYERFFSEIILDGVAQILIIFCITACGILLLNILPQTEKVVVIFILCYFSLSVLLCYSYQVIQLHLSQSTWGMRLCYLKLVDKWGNKPSLLRILVRQFIYGLLSLLFALTIFYLMRLFYDNYIWVMEIGCRLSIALSIILTYMITLFNKDRRTIHDLIAGTYVTYNK